MKPSLRFPEFTDDWSTKKIGDILTIGNGRDYKHLGEGDIPVYGTGGYMLSVDDYLYEGESVAIGRKGTIDKPQFLSGKFWTVDTLFYTRDYVDSCPRFVFEIFNNINWQRYNEATGVPSLSKSTIEKVKVNIPSKQEQEKIAEFLTAVDERIELTSRKVEKLEAYKRGLTQKIFTRTLRFKRDDGSDFPEWETTKLGDIVDKGFINMGRGMVISATDVDANPGEYPIYSSSVKNNGLFGRYGNYMFDSEMITWSIDGGGDFFYRPTHRFSITNVSGFIKVIDENLVDTKFLASQLQYLQGRQVFDYTTKAHPSVICNIYTLGMPLIEEQQKIAAFLSQIDEKITLETQKLEELKKFKKALLQRMFV
ncbi:MAG: restriction endonuclease subunit S [Candidatus Saccharibacteria bacterium]|nr:restriction endonuclease subunit S [Candidatus Saccharibacteria bacterium]